MSIGTEELNQDYNAVNNFSDAGEPVKLQYFDYSDSDGPDGGHWNRIISEAEQIAEAGFNGVWVQSPAEPNTEVSNGYNPKNLLNWDSDLGTEEEFDEMLEELNRNDVELYIDGILNHAGAEPPSEADYPLDREHFHHPDSEHRTELKLCGLWSYDHEHPEVREYLGEYIDLAEQKGVDGYRWDAVKHVPEWFFDEFVNDWIPDDAFTVGEAFDDNMDLLKSYIDTGMNLFDFPLLFRMQEGFSSWGDIRTVSAAVDSYNHLEKSILAENSFRSSTFVENHDTAPPEHEKLAHAFIMTAPGYPTVYSNHAEEDEGVDFTADWLTDLIDIKTNLAAGEIDFQETENKREVLVYSRDNYVVGINKSDEDYIDDVETYWDEPNLVDLTGENQLFENSHGSSEIRIPGNDYVVCAPVE